MSTGCAHEQIQGEVAAKCDLPGSPTDERPGSVIGVLASHDGRLRNKRGQAVTAFRMMEGCEKGRNGFSQEPPTGNETGREKGNGSAEVREERRPVRGNSAVASENEGRGQQRSSGLQVILHPEELRAMPVAPEEKKKAIERALAGGTQ